MKNENKLKGRDLINIGIFGAIYFAIIFAIAMLGMIPIFLPLLSVFVPILGGIPFMLFLTKVKKPGMIFIMAMIMGIFTERICVIVRSRSISKGCPCARCVTRKVRIICLSIWILLPMHGRASIPCCYVKGRRSLPVHTSWKAGGRNRQGERVSRRPI